MIGSLWYTSCDSLVTTSESSGNCFDVKRELRSYVKIRSESYSGLTQLTLMTVQWINTAHINDCAGPSTSKCVGPACIVGCLESCK